MSDEDRTTYNGRYEVQRRVARGGMADVFLARDLLLARPVAVKVLFPEFAGDPSFVARFRREAQAAANLNHPNIVGVYDWGQEAGTYYIVMEFIDGRSLSEILRTQGTPPAKTAAGIAADVAAALGFAHRNGVVHRDIKPGNIMITNSGHVKVADFGIARAITASAEENLTQTGSVMGTATYFSPEQAQGHNVEGRSDLYSLGIVMYEMAHGRPPFTADSPIAVAYKHVQEAPPSLREAHPEVPPGYEAIVMRLLAKSPDDRYPDADALRSDLRRFAEGRRVGALAGAGAGAAAGAAGAAAAASRTRGDGPADASEATRSAPAVPPATPPDGGSAVTVDEVSPPDDETRVEQAHRSRTGWFVLVLLLALAAIGGLLYLFAETLGIGETESVEVPTVVGRPEATARQVLEAEGLVVPANSERQRSDEIPAGAVISQDPEPGAEVERGSTVTLIVSSGSPPAETIPMPNVVGMDFDEAVDELLERGFSRADIASPRVIPSDAPEDEVVTQSPRAGSDVAEGSTIQLTVSSGVPPTTEPPETEPPATEPPATDPPETDPPETDPPETDPPETDPPETDPPPTESSTSSSSSSSSSSVPSE